MAYEGAHTMEHMTSTDWGIAVIMSLFMTALIVELILNLLGIEP